MKIDIHVHTKKTKKGDSLNRNIDEEHFAAIVKSTDVGIIAITNHNDFDYSQFVKLVEKTAGICQLWPGVELDIEEEGRRGHLLVIVNPKNAQNLEDKVTSLTSKTTADAFTISIEETIKAFDNLDTIYIAHYKKAPALIDADISKIQAMTINPSRVIKEASNAISAGIFISDGHLSIYGSDVHNWNNYAADSEKLPDLRLPVDSFEQFCLLLKRDEPTINTILDQKQHELLQIRPFQEDKESINLKVFNDINVFFGSKGTGKTKILEAISKLYNENGMKTKVYKASSEKIEENFDIKGNNLTINLADYNVDDCEQEIKFLRSVSDVAITNPSEYKRYFENEMTNERAKRIKINGFANEDDVGATRQFNELEKSRKQVNEFIDFIFSEPEIKKTIEPEILDRARTVLNEISIKLKSESEIRFVKSKSFVMFNKLIKCISGTISRKTGKPAKPISTGFANYARNRISIEQNINKIKDNIIKPIVLKPSFVGDLGEKGTLYCKTEVILQTGEISDGKFLPLSKVNKTPQKNFSKAINDLKQKIYNTNFFESLTNMWEQESIDSINSLEDLLLFHRYFVNNGQQYTPSSGESSMLLLHKELQEEKDIYLLDEPEKSLGNDYINDVIVPMLKERVKMGKKVFVATHDANIAVRTLPYNSIYRKHNIEGYSTYLGNPFSNHLVNLSDPTDLIDWKEISMKTLEGGKEAFGERGKIYGNV